MPDDDHDDPPNLMTGWTDGWIDRWMDSGFELPEPPFAFARSGGSEMANAVLALGKIEAAEMLASKRLKG